MCGIFGYVGQSAIEDIDPLLNIGVLNVKRGNQAFGYLAVAKQGYLVGRHEGQFSKSFDFSYLNSYNLILFHLLSSTGSDKRIHPFETDQFVFAHNGILIDYQEHTGLSHLGPVDSQYLLAAIDGYDNHLSNPLSNSPVSMSIMLANERFNGQRACWLWDKFDQSLYLWRVMSPLYIMQSEDALLFSSYQCEKRYTLLEEGVIYQVKDCIIKQVDKFNFYSPYHIKEAA